MERNCYDFEVSGEQRRNIYTRILPPYIWHHRYTTSSFHPVNMHAPLSLCLFVAWSAALSERHPEIRWVKCSQHVPTGTGELNLTGVDLGALPSTLHCGRIDVPMDYSRPMCEQNKITLGLAMYRPVKPKGVLFYNPGGTNAAAVIA